MASPKPPPTDQAPSVMLTVEQAAEQLGIGRTTTYALLRSGQLRSVLVGRLRRVPANELHAYTTQLIAQQNPAPTEGN